MISFGLLGFAKIFFGFSFIVADLPIANLAFGVWAITFCFLNIRQPSIVVAMIGTVSNVFVLTVNKGYMPIDSQVFMEYGGNLADLSSKGGQIMTDATRLSLLGDWMYFPYAGGVFSPGDVLVLLGCLILVIQYEKFHRNQANF